MQTLTELATAKQGVNIITKGLNRNCEPVVAKGILFYSEVGNEYMLKQGGIYIEVYASDVSKMYADTPENRKQLKSTFNK